MKTQMKNDNFLITVTSLILLIYLMAVGMNSSFGLVFFLMLAVQVAFIFMVIAILKSPDKPKHTFKDRFYLDKDYKPLGD